VRLPGKAHRAVKLAHRIQAILVLLMFAGLERGDRPHDRYTLVENLGRIDGPRAKVSGNKGVGLEIDIVVREKGAPARPPSAAEDEVIAVRSAVLDQLEATIHREIDAWRVSSRTAPSSAKAETG
jgi:hypothetical protein